MAPHPLGVERLEPGLRRDDGGVIHQHVEAGGGCAHAAAAARDQHDGYLPVFNHRNPSSLAVQWKRQSPAGGGVPRSIPGQA